MNNYLGNGVYADYNHHDLFLKDGKDNKSITLTPDAINKLKEFLNAITTLPTKS